MKDKRVEDSIRGAIPEQERRSLLRTNFHVDVRERGFASFFDIGKIDNDRCETITSWTEEFEPIGVRNEPVCVRFVFLARIVSQDVEGLSVR